MSPANRPGGRERRTVSGGGNVYRRGSGLGGGGVGGGGHIGGGGSSGGGGDRGFGSGGGGLLAVILALLIGGASNNNGNGGSNRSGCLKRILILAVLVVVGIFLFRSCSGSSSGGVLDRLFGDLTTPTDSGGSSLSSVDGNTDTSTSGSSVSDMLGSLLGSGATSGQISPVSASEPVYAAHEPDTSVSSAAREKYVDVAATKTVTVMVYMCGTDLESEGGMATSDIEEMANATLSDNVRVILETGGTSRWQNELIKSNTNRVSASSGAGWTRSIKTSASSPWSSRKRSRASFNSAKASIRRIATFSSLGITAAVFAHG